MFVVNVRNSCRSSSVRIVYQDGSNYTTSTQAATCPDTPYSNTLLFLVLFPSVVPTCRHKCDKCSRNLSSSEFFAKCTGCSLCYHASCTRVASNQLAKNQALASFSIQGIINFNLLQHNLTNRVKIFSFRLLIVTFRDRLMIKIISIICSITNIMIYSVLNIS